MPKEVKSVKLVLIKSEVEVIPNGGITFEQEVDMYIGRIENIIEEECILNDKNRTKLLNCLNGFYDLYKKI